MSPLVWKMFAATFAFVLIVTHVVADIPSYIHVCGRRDPDLQKCITNSVDNLSEKFCEGIPELGAVPLDPLVFKKIKLFDAPGIKVMLRDTTISGLCDWTRNYFHMDLDKQFDINLTFSRVVLNGTLDIDAHVLVPIVLQEPMLITTDNMSALASFKMKIVTKNGVRYLHLPKISLDLDIKGYDVVFPVDNIENLYFREIAIHFLERGRMEILATMKPFLEEIISENLLNLANNIVTHFTYDELFPDRV